MKNFNFKSNKLPINIPVFAERGGGEKAATNLQFSGFFTKNENNSKNKLHQKGDLALRLCFFQRLMFHFMQFIFRNHVTFISLLQNNYMAGRTTFRIIPWITEKLLNKTFCAFFCATIDFHQICGTRSDIVYVGNGPFEKRVFESFFSNFQTFSFSKII